MAKAVTAVAGSLLPPLEDGGPDELGVDFGLSVGEGPRYVLSPAGTFRIRASRKRS